MNRSTMTMTWALGLMVFAAACGECSDETGQGSADSGSGEGGESGEGASKAPAEPEAGSPDRTTSGQADAVADAGRLDAAVGLDGSISSDPRDARSDAPDTEGEQSVAVGLGGHCESDADCATGICDQGWDAGYCTHSCSVPGEEDTCGSEGMCGTLCETLQPRCFRRCEQGSASACRPNYLCQLELTRVATVCLPLDCDLNDHSTCVAPATCRDEWCFPICTDTP